MVRVKVTRNYRITIPREIRRRMGIEEGSYVPMEMVGETTAIMKRVLPIEDLAGAWDKEMDKKKMDEVRKLWKTWVLQRLYSSTPMFSWTI